MSTHPTHQAKTEQPGQGKHLRELDPQTTYQLASFAQGRKVTLNTLVQTAWALLLQRHCGQETVASGVTAVGQLTELPGTEVRIGLFIDTLPTVAAPQPQQSVVEYLQGMQALNLVLREHEHTPLYDIQCQARYGGEALFDNILVPENFPVTGVLHQAPTDLKFSTPGNRERTNYPLTLGVTPGKHLSPQYIYVRRDSDATNIAELDHHLLHLLQQMVKTPQAASGEPTLLDVGECQEVLRDRQALLKTLLQGGAATAFTHQAASTPEVVTLVRDGEYLSCAELDTRAERLTCSLRTRGVAVKTLVAIAAEHSFDLIVGLPDILRTGAGYPSLDPNYSAERPVYMLRDSSARWLTCQGILAEWLPCPAGVEWLPLETAAWPASVDTRPLLEIAGEMLAYAVYTSGSIGQPKGVAVSQVILVACCQATTRTHGVGPSDCQLQFVSISFDAAAEQLFVPLLVRARVLFGDTG